MSEIVELIELPTQETALSVFQKPDGLEPWLQKIRDQVSGIVPDLTTRKGREEIGSRAFKVRKAKTALDALGKKLVDDLKDVPRKIDAERKRMRDTLDALADEVRQPLTQWERAEQARVATHKDLITWINLRGTENRDLDCGELRTSIVEVEEIEIGPHLEEFEPEVARAKDKALASLRDALVVREKHEAEQAELTRLRKEAAEREARERDERIAREAAERTRAEAEAKAHAEQEAAAKREAQAKAAAEKAESDRLEAVERQKQAEARAEAEKLAAEERAKQAAEAARLAEVERQHREQERAAEEQRKRQADRKHKAVVNNEAVAALIAGGLTAEAAKLAVVLIAKGTVPAVRINY